LEESTSYEVPQYAVFSSRQRMHKNQEPLFAELNTNGNSQLDPFEIHGRQWIAEHLNKEKCVKYYSKFAGDYFSSS
jgi:hypothetical protein